MIYGALEDLPRYRGFCRSLDVLIDWLAENDPSSLDVGSHAILGDKVFANVMAPTTRPEEGAHYETHHRYHDLQIDVEGRESFKVSQGETTLVEPFNEADDFELVDAKNGIAGDCSQRAPYAHAGVSRRRCCSRKEDLLQAYRGRVFRRVTNNEWMNRR